MNLLIRKYLLCNGQFRVFVINRNQINAPSLENDVLCIAALSTMLLSQEERITFNFKNKNNERFLYIDAFSNGECLYQMETDKITDMEPKLFVTKSKLKNFGASYNSIMQFEKFEVLKNINAYYKESEQMELAFIEQKETILMIQPLPSFEETQYDWIKEELCSNEIEILSEDLLVETTNISVMSLQ